MDGLNFLLPACKPRRRAAARRAVDTADAALKADVPALSNAGVRRRPDSRPVMARLPVTVLQCASGCCSRSVTLRGGGDRRRHC